MAALKLFILNMYSVDTQRPSLHKNRVSLLRVDDLFLILKAEYFNKIKAGTKTSEFRLMTAYWLTRLTSKNWTHVTFQMGYASDAPRVRKKITGIEIVTIEHEFFGNQPVDVFEIKLS